MQRLCIEIQGIVQGVGFRPFVHQLAIRHQLVGFVKNQAGSALVEVEGPASAIENFLHELQTSPPPPLARIETIHSKVRPPQNDTTFRIVPSDADATGIIFISPDVAPCSACLQEMHDPNDRRYRYPFLNCTNCGPRLTIIRSAPYDRERTTMSGFARCPDCDREYQDSTDRRFHAQPIACPLCGPHLRLDHLRGEDALRAFVKAMREGKIGAIKGVGGFQFCCDARDEQAVQKLRHRKHRDEKPFAVMVRNVENAQSLCVISEQEKKLLTAASRPIVLLRRCHQQKLANEVAPGNPCLGIMLPSTPLHELLLEEMQDIPLVMTSGNRSEEPIVFRDDETDSLREVADVILTHNRPIHLRCDDSVIKVIAETAIPFRRARGYAPQPIRLPIPCPVPMLALGGQLKSVFALGQENHAILSQHLGDLDHYEAFLAFRETIEHYQELFDVTPELLIHDLHPDYASTRYAEERNLPRLGVQHHHAHLASCMAEHGLNKPTIGIIYDGTGHGLDETIWGGEILIGSYTRFRRFATLRSIPMPGGEVAIREPWRMGLAYLLDAGENENLLTAIDPQMRRVVHQMIDRNFNCPRTSGMGRLFDAVASLLGIRQRVSYEGQAAMELEWLANEEEGEPYPCDLIESENGQPVLIDVRPMMHTIVQDVVNHELPQRVSQRFHSTLAEITMRICERIRIETGAQDVALSGGVFMNELLTRQLVKRLRQGGFQTYLHREVPPNDGGLCLGQLAIAAALGEEAFAPSIPWGDLQMERQS